MSRRVVYLLKIFLIYYKKTAVFFSDSYKRTCIWKNFLSKDQTGNDKLRKIKKLGTTWWNSKDAALKNIFDPWSESNETSDRYDFYWNLNIFLVQINRLIQIHHLMQGFY